MAFAATRWKRINKAIQDKFFTIHGLKYWDEAKSERFVVTDSSEGFPEYDRSLGPLNTDETAGSNGVNRYRPSLFCAFSNSFSKRSITLFYFYNKHWCMCMWWLCMRWCCTVCLCKQMWECMSVYINVYMRACTAYYLSILFILDNAVFWRVTAMKFRFVCNLWIWMTI